MLDVPTSSLTTCTQRFALQIGLADPSRVAVGLNGLIGGGIGTAKYSIILSVGSPVEQLLAELVGAFESLQVLP